MGRGPQHIDGLVLRKAPNHLMFVYTLNVSGKFEPVMGVTNDRGHSQDESEAQTDPCKGHSCHRSKDLPATDQEWNRNHRSNG